MRYLFLTTDIWKLTSLLPPLLPQGPPSPGGNKHSIVHVKPIYSESD
jgi:hypothetical protein